MTIVVARAFLARVSAAILSKWGMKQKQETERYKTGCGYPGGYQKALSHSDDCLSCRIWWVVFCTWKNVLVVALPLSPYPLPPVGRKRSVLLQLLWSRLSRYGPRKSKPTPLSFLFPSRLHLYERWWLRGVLVAWGGGEAWLLSDMFRSYMFQLCSLPFSCIHYCLRQGFFCIKVSLLKSLVVPCNPYVPANPWE